MKLKTVWAITSKSTGDIYCIVDSAGMAELVIDEHAAKCDGRRYLTAIERQVWTFANWNKL